MARLVFRKLKVRKPPASKAEKVLLRPPPKIANVIKPKPKPIAQRAASKQADLNERIASRNRYRKNAGVVMDSCLENLDVLDELANRYVVITPSGDAREIEGFTIVGLGEPLKTSGPTVTRWVNRGMLPEPFLETSRGKVYHIEEAREMVRIIGNHQKEFRQYRNDHEDVKDKLFTAIYKVRTGLFPPK
jgi:hypothetical protein